MDYGASLTQVFRMTTLNIIQVMEAERSWHAQFVNVIGAYLHAFIDRDIYMRRHRGYEKRDPLTGKPYVVTEECIAWDTISTASVVSNLHKGPDRHRAYGNLFRPVSFVEGL